MLFASFNKQRRKKQAAEEILISKIKKAKIRTMSGMSDFFNSKYRIEIMYGKGELLLKIIQLE